MARRSTHPFVRVVVAALVLTGCGSSYGRAEGIADLQEELGIDEATATCFVDAIEARDVTIREVVTEGNVDDPEVVAAVNAAARDCIDADEQASERDEFVRGYVEASGADEAQAECVYDEITADGTRVGDLDGTALADGVAAALEVCAPDVSAPPPGSS